MTRKNQIITPFLLAALLMSGLCAAAEPERKVIAHVVVAWLKPEFQTEGYIEKLFEANKLLLDIPQVQSMRTGRPVKSNAKRADDSFDLGNVLTFKSIEDMNEYLVHPIHAKFISDFITGKVEKVIAYDF